MNLINFKQINIFLSFFVYLLFHYPDQKMSITQRESTMYERRDQKHLDKIEKANFKSQQECLNFLSGGYFRTTSKLTLTCCQKYKVSRVAPKSKVVVQSYDRWNYHANHSLEEGPKRLMLQIQFRGQSLKFYNTLNKQNTEKQMTGNISFTNKCHQKDS